MVDSSGDYALYRWSGAYDSYPVHMIGAINKINVFLASYYKGMGREPTLSVTFRVDSQST
jgi:hypothetical protein